MSLELLIIVLIAWTCVSWLRQDLAFALLAALVPVYQIRFEFAGIPFTLLELLLLIVCATWAVKQLIIKKRPFVPFPWLLLAFVLAGVVATVFSADVRAGLGLLKAYILEPVFIFIVGVNVLQTGKSLRRFEWALIALVSVVAFVGLLQWGGVFDIPEPYASENPARATSVFPFPTAVGKLLGPLVALSAVFVVFTVQFFKTGARLRILGYAGAAALGGLVLFVSRNRGALVGCAVALVVTLFFHTRKKIIIPLLLCAALLLVALTPLLRTELVQVIQGTDTSTDVRLVMWQGTWRLIQHHPFVGAGLGGFPILYDVYRDASHVELFPNPDSLYLTLWAELGLLGIVVFLWLFFVWGRQIHTLISDHKAETKRFVYGVAALAFIVALLTHGLVDTPYFKNDLAVIFWMVFALLTVLAQRRVKEDSL